jgi:hypothetical protein
MKGTYVSHLFLLYILLCVGEVFLKTCLMYKGAAFLVLLT